MIEHTRNVDDLSFWEALQSEKQRCREALPYQHRLYSYIDRGFYLEQLRRLWFYFSKEQVLVLKSEYLRNQPKEVINDVCDFLEVERFAISEQKNSHSRPYSSFMKRKEKQYLQFLFEYEIKSIERVLNWDCRDWLSD